MPAARLAAATMLLSLLVLGACSRVGGDWKAAQAADTTESYQEFLQQHPGSEYAVQAQERIKQLAEDRDWQQASALDTRDAYEQFVAQHADGKWAQEARVRIENFQLAAGTAVVEPAGENVADAAVAPAPAAAPAPVPAPSAARANVPAPAAPAAQKPAGGWYAQLGAFSSRDNAEAAWARLRKQFSTQLRSLQPRYEAGKSQARTVYRLQVGVGSEQKARELCAALKKQSQGCVPVPG